MKGNKLTIQNLGALEVFNKWGKVEVRIKDLTSLTLAIEGPIDRFEVLVHPNGKTMFNRVSYMRCFGTGELLQMEELKDCINSSFETVCFDTTENEDVANQLVAL